MKHLYLLRHSKAGQTNKKITEDHERPLTQKGEDLCKTIASHTKKKNIVPELILSSNSVRTRQTATLVSENAGIEPTIELSHRLYLAAEDDLYSEIASVDDGINSLMIVGHNPGLHHFCLWLAGDANDRKQYQLLKSTFPPGALASFELECDAWADVNKGGATLTDLLIPKRTTG